MEAEHDGEARQLIDNLKATLAQTHETMKRINADQDLYAGRTGDFHRAMAARLRELGYDHALHIFPGQGHGYMPETYLPLTLDFFEKHSR